MPLELTTVSAVQNYLGDTSISSTLLTAIINAAESAIARRCNRYDDTQGGNHWLSASRTEFLDGEWSSYVGLKYTPISAISSIATIYGSGSSSSHTLTNFTCDGIEIADLATNKAPRGKLIMRFASAATQHAFDYGLPYSGDTVDLGVYGLWTGLGGGAQRIKVVYTGGFSTAPADLHWAATVLSAQMYRDQTRDPTVKSETLGDYSVTYMEGVAEQTLSLGSLDGLIANHLRPVF